MKRIWVRCPLQSAPKVVREVTWIADSERSEASSVPIQTEPESSIPQCVCVMGFKKTWSPSSSTSRAGGMNAKTSAGGNAPRAGPPADINLDVSAGGCRDTIKVRCDALVPRMDERLTLFNANDSWRQRALAFGGPRWRRAYDISPLKICRHWLVQTAAPLRLRVRSSGSLGRRVYAVTPALIE